jgi:hypothetical protein
MPVVGSGSATHYSHPIVTYNIICKPQYNFRHIEHNSQVNNMSTTTTQTQQSTGFGVKEDAPIEIPRGSVDAKLTFYAPPADGSAPFNYVEKPPQGEPQRNYTEDTHTVTVHDIRGHESEYDFNVSGFGVLQNVPASSEKEFTSDDSIKANYYP